MKKENFVLLIVGTIGGILFAIGMCMRLLPEWNTFQPGVVMAAIGIVVLLAMLIVHRKMEGKPAVKLNAKTIGVVALGIVGALVLVVGMCMTMVWQNLMVPGIVVGVSGLLLLLCLIRFARG